MSRPACFVLVLSLMWPAALRAQTTLLILDSQPGDYIGGGTKQTFTLADGGFTARQNFDGGVSVSFIAPEYAHWWSLDFAAAGDAPLTPGLYDAATRFPFQDPGEPGFDVGGDGRGCNTLTGRFEVVEVKFGPAETVLSFAANFEQHCEGPHRRSSERYSSTRERLFHRISHSASAGVQAATRASSSRPARM